MDEAEILNQPEDGATAFAVRSPQGQLGGCGCGGLDPTCPECGAAAAVDAPDDATDAPRFVYAIGRVELRFPSLALEKEFDQAVPRVSTEGLTDRQTVHAVLSAPENRYLARQVCYILNVGGAEAYILVPRDPGDLRLLVDAIRPEPSPLDLDVVVGVRGPVAPPNVCGGLTLPLVMVDQIWSFDRPELLKAVPRPKGKSGKQFEAAAAELLERIVGLADNAGAADEHRALNYLIVRYPAIYTQVADRYDEDFALTAVEARPSTSGVRRVVDVVFSWTNRTTTFVEKAMVRVDVSEEFPFVLTPLTPFLER